MSEPIASTTEQDAGGNADEDIGDISSIDLATRMQVIIYWNERRSIKQISGKTGLSLKVVGRIISQKEKSDLRKKGGKS